MAPTSSTVPPTRSACVPKTLRPDLENEHRRTLLPKREQVAKRRPVVAPDPDRPPGGKRPLQVATVVGSLVIRVPEMLPDGGGSNQHAARSEKPHQLPDTGRVVTHVLQHFIAVHQIELPWPRRYRGEDRMRCGAAELFRLGDGGRGDIVAHRLGTELLEPKGED